MRLEALVLALVLLPWSQNPVPVPPAAGAAGTAQTPETKPLSPEQLRTKQIADQLEGCWQLSSADSPMLDLANLQMTGYAIFREGYMSLEIHGVGLTLANQSNLREYIFQTGFQRYQINPNGMLETYSLIGSTNTMDRLGVQFEMPGMRRSFRTEFKGSSMTLARSDGARLTFMKLGALPFPGQKSEIDMFGRKVPRESAAPAGGVRQQ